jgi:hypothetical protein
MLALLVGLVEVALGLGKLGFVADLLSSEVQVGYMNGRGISIIACQLPTLFGFSTDATSFAGEVSAFVRGLDTADADALFVGLGTLAVLVGVSFLPARVPGVLVAVVGATVVVSVFDLAAKGVPVVGELPQGLPRPVLPWTELDDVGPLALAAVGIVLVSLADSIAVSTAFAARNPMTGGDHRAGADLRPGLDHRAVEHPRADADQRPVLDRAAVEHRLVADDDAGADRRRVALVGHVDDRPVLDVGGGADPDRVDVAAQHGAEPHRHVVAQLDVPDHRRPRRHEHPSPQARLAVLVRKEGHRDDRRIGRSGEIGRERAERRKRRQGLAV